MPGTLKKLEYGNPLFIRVVECRYDAYLHLNITIKEDFINISIYVDQPHRNELVYVVGIGGLHKS